MKFLVIQTASIGDVILATPVIEKLNHDFPGSRIDFLLKQGNEDLFKGHPFLGRIFVWDKQHNKYKNFIRILSEIRNSHYDHVVNLQRFAATGVLTVFSGAGNKIGFDKNPFSVFFNKRVKHTIRNGSLHETQRNLLLIDSITKPGSAKVKLYPSTDDFAMVSRYKSGQYLCIAPASIWFTKQYPKEKWVEFLKSLPKNNKVYFLGSKKDSELCDWIKESSGYTNAVNLAGRLSFLQTAALMKDAKMNFVNDSSPIHLASAVNARVTAIFCSTVPAFGFGPLSDDSLVIETTKVLSCRPCGLHGFNSCPEKHFDCARTIDVKDLINRI
jgi:ADP-heptose:LPS heptosyltransferase